MQRLKLAQAVTSAPFSLDKHMSHKGTSCVPKCCYHLVHYCLIWYCLIKICIVMCFTEGIKRFRCKVMFENEHTLCSWMWPCSHLHNVCATGVSSGLATKVTLTRVSHRMGGSLLKGVDSLLIWCLYHST